MLLDDRFHEPIRWQDLCRSESPHNPRYGAAHPVLSPVRPVRRQVPRNVFGPSWNSDLGLALISLVSGTPIVAGEFGCFGWWEHTHRACPCA